MKKSKKLDNGSLCIHEPRHYIYVSVSTYIFSYICSVWVQSQQVYHRYGVCPQTAPREMQGAEQRTECSVCGPDQSV